jgi:hypothetical protein
MLNEQAKLSDNQDPKFLSNDINDKIEELKREVNYLISKIKYFRPKTTKKPATSEPKASNNNTNGTSSESEQTKPDGENGSTEQTENNNNGGEESKFGEDFFDKKEDGTDNEKKQTNPDEGEKQNKTKKIISF